MTGRSGGRACCGPARGGRGVGKQQPTVVGSEEAARERAAGCKIAKGYAAGEGREGEACRRRR